MNRHDIEEELKGTQMVLMAAIDELGGEFEVTIEKLNAADSKYKLDTRETSTGDILFLVEKEH